MSSDSDASDGLITVIGIGASAGGLQALEEFFDSCPPESGAAFAVVQHLSPSHDSLMEGLLSKHSVMPVTMLQESKQIVPNHIYLIPPGGVMQLRGNMLELTPRASGFFLPIDIFFESLAQQRRERSVVVILSGTGSDGTRGAKAVNAANGFVLSQSPEEAGFDGMPSSVLRSGVVDDCLPVGQLARRALRLSSLVPKDEARDVLPELPQTTDIVPGEEMSAIRAILLRNSSIDFSDYKDKTIDRRIERRMHALGLTELREYACVLRAQGAEVDSLVRDLLIGVTNFFRDHYAFDVLEQSVIPEIVAHLADDEEARIWVAGCSTGEEAYSIGILFMEAFEAAGRPANFRLFATDVNEASLDVASNGIYPTLIREEVSSDRLQTFFVPEGEQFRVSTELRKHLVFARHDLLNNPPFTRLMLVSCRNTLIYLKPAAQEHALNMLRFSVRKNGYMFLGRSETLLDKGHDFQPVDAAEKIFQRMRRGLVEPINISPEAVSRLTPNRELANIRQKRLQEVASVAKDASRMSHLKPERALLDHWAPPAILVDRSSTVHQFQGDLSAFLKTRSGTAHLTLDALLPDTLNGIGSLLIEEVFKQGALRVSEPMDFVARDRSITIRLIGIPVFENNTTPLVYLCFETLSDRNRPKEGVVRLDPELLARSHTARLEQMLRENRADLQNAIEMLETANEELQSTNEELMASNEELQSTNEELQSVNEEINTVNVEYQLKIGELDRVSQELESVLRGAGLATIFLDESQRVMRFSAGAQNYFRLRDSDIGRPLSELTHSLNYESIQDDIEKAMQERDIIERELTARTDEVVRLRVVPYHLQAGQPPRTVLTLLDISAYREIKRLQGVLDALPAHVAVIDFDGTIAMTNASWDRFAIANGDANLECSGVGCNYLAVCEQGDKPLTSDQSQAMDAFNGIKSVLEGTSAQFSMRYPCHSPDKKRWFHMTVSPILEQGRGAVITHVDITQWRQDNLDAKA